MSAITSVRRKNYTALLSLALTTLFAGSASAFTSPLPEGFRCTALPTSSEIKVAWKPSPRHEKTNTPYHVFRLPVAGTRIEDGFDGSSAVISSSRIESTAWRQVFPPDRWIFIYLQSQDPITLRTGPTAHLRAWVQKAGKVGSKCDPPVSL